MDVFKERTNDCKKKSTIITPLIGGGGGGGSVTSVASIDINMLDAML